MNRVSATGLLLAAAAGCAADVPLMSREQHVDKGQYLERARCDTYACLLWSGTDSDADGVIDDDERALGTDPMLGFDRPSDRELLARIGTRDLPSWTQGQITVVVLPTKTPEGDVLFGGEAGKPSREELFDLMKLGDVLGSFDLSRGVVVNPALGGPDLTTPGLGTYEDKSLAMGKLPDIARDVAQYCKDPQVIDDWGYGLRSDGGDMQFGSLQRDHRDGSTDDIRWQSLGDETSASLVEKDASGHVTSTARITEKTTSSNGVTHTSRTTTTESAGMVTLEGVDTFVDDSTGEKYETKKWTTTEKDDKSGAVYTTTGSSTSHTSTDGETDKHTSTTTTRCEDGDCQVVKQTDSGEGTTCEASKDACDPDAGAGAYRDPDYMEPEPDMAAVQLRMDSAPIHTFNDPMGPPGAPTPPEGLSTQNGNGIYVLTTGDPDTTILLRENWTTGTVQPDYDPTLPVDGPPSEMPPVGSCYDCSGD